MSALTLVRGRADHLYWLVASLTRQHQPPEELVIAYMQDEPHQGLPETSFPVVQVFVPGDELPLAAARNRAARAATGEGLLFLDVDCVTSPGVVGAASQALDAIDGVFMPEVWYLPEGALGPPDPAADEDAIWDTSALEAVGERHPARPAPPEHGWRHEPDHGQLWGLAFALRRQTFLACGGFDERYVGYGGEETDFARALAKHDVPLYYLAGARSFHQYHPVHRPPLQHFDAIVRNARLFRTKWGRECMSYWLDWFERDGYIQRDPEGSIAVLRRPTPRDIQAARASAEHIYG